MVEQINTSPQNSEELVQTEKEKRGDDNLLNEEMNSADDEDDVAPAALNPQSSFPKVDVISTGREESISAVTDTNASGNSVSLDSTIAGSTGPPSSIIQKFDVESEQLINLDSIQDSEPERESDTSDLAGIIAKRDDDKTSWLNIDSSSTSQGSQGSYAHQVPALLGSYGSTGVDGNQQPNKTLLPHQLPFPKDTPPDESNHSRSSKFQNLENPQTSNLDDILGPKGMPLGPDGEPLESDLDDILGPQSDGKPSDLDDTLGPYEGSKIGPSSLPPSCQSAVETQAPQTKATTEVSENLRDDDAIVEKQNSQVQSENLSSLWSGSKDSLESKSTIESKGKIFSETSRSAVGVTSGSSYGDTIGVETSQDDRLQNQSSLWDSSQNEAISPTSRSRKTEHTFSSVTSTSAEYAFSSSQRGSFSPRDPSIQSGTSVSSREESSNPTNVFSDTTYTSCTEYISDASRSRIHPLSTEGSSYTSPTKHNQFSPTEHTTSTYGFSSTSTKAVQASPTKHSRFSRTERTDCTSNAICSIDESFSEGGRMWREAQIQAANSKDKPLSPRAKKFAESIMARTRSRADPDSLLNNSATSEAAENPSRSMINVNAQEEGRFIESALVAKKRGRVVQLLTIGLLSFLISFVGGLLVLSSCYFVSAPIQGGDDGEEYDLHFGLWKYSPVYSASQGYSYCNNYDGDFIGGAPWFGRLSSFIALLGGGYSLGVLWLYLLLGKCVKTAWKIAVYTTAASGLLQLSTLSIFTGNICREQECTLGPAGMISIVAGCFYFVLAHEMHHNTPLEDLSEPHHAVTNLEMTDFENGARAYVQRIIFGGSTSYHQKAGNQSNIGETKDQEGPSYVPPIV